MAESADIDHTFGNDIEVSNTGDLNAVTGLLKSQERILRRLMTNPRTVLNDGTVLPADDMFDPEYGAGLPRYVGRTFSVPEVVGRIRGQMQLEDTVAVIPPPDVRVTPLNGGLQGMNVYIRYVNTQSGAQATLSFNVTP